MIFITWMWFGNYWNMLFLMFYLYLYRFANICHCLLIIQKKACATWIIYIGLPINQYNGMGFHSTEVEDCRFAGISWDVDRSVYHCIKDYKGIRVCKCTLLTMFSVLPMLILWTSDYPSQSVWEEIGIDQSCVAKVIIALSVLRGSRYLNMIFI